MIWNFDEHMRQMEKNFICKALIKCKGRVREACNLTGVVPSSMWRMMERNHVMVKVRSKFGEAVEKPEGWTVIWRDRATKRPR